MLLAPTAVSFLTVPFVHVLLHVVTKHLWSGGADVSTKQDFPLTLAAGADIQVRLAVRKIRYFHFIYMNLFLTTFLLHTNSRN